MEFNEKEMLQKFFEEEESEYWDYKAKYHTNNAELVHDILCLANSDTDKDRQLIFGVSDDKRDFPGIKDDPNRKKQREVVDVLRKVSLNRIPEIKIETIKICDKEFDKLIILNRPYKPYFINKRYSVDKIYLNAGTVYTRNKDSNTPKDQCANDLQIEKMYLERYAMHKTPLERAKIYLRDVNKWKRLEKENNEYFYYELFPEFNLVAERQNNIQDDFNEPWVHEFPDNKAWRDIYNLNYLSTTLLQIHFISCDGCRYIKTLPERKVIQHTNPERYIYSYYFIQDSIEYLASQMIQNSFRSFSRMPKHIFSCFDTKKQAELAINQDYYENNKKKYIYYFYDADKKENYSLRQGERFPLHSNRIRN